MDALKKAEKEKKEAAKRRQTGQHPILSTGEHPVSQDDTHLSVTDTQASPSGSEPTQEVSLELQPLSGEETLMGGDTNESGITNTQIIQDDDTENTQLLNESTNETLLTLGEEIDDLDLDLEDTQLIGDMTDETIIEKTIEKMMEEEDLEVSHADNSQTIGFENTDEFHHEDTDELHTSLAEDNLDDETLGLRLETLEHSRDAQDSEPEHVEQPPVVEPSQDQTDEKVYRSNIGHITDPSLELEALDSVSVTQMLRDIGQHEGQPTPAAASTVFAASKTENWGSRIGYGLVAALAILLLITGGLFIHYQTTPEVPQVVSPTVAKGVEAQKSSTITSLSDLTDEANQTETSVIAQNTESSTTADAAEAPVDTVYVEHSDPLASTSTSDESLVAGTTTVAEPISEPDTAVQTTSAEAAIETVSEESVAMLEPERNFGSGSTQVAVVYSPVAAPVSPSMIKISRTAKKRTEFITNQRAYDAYQQGQYDVAASIYQISLKEKPDNRDALLGLAAIKLKKGDQQGAYNLYRKVLKLNPKDPVARLSLVNMQNQVGSNDNESLLKNLIQDSPNNPGLYFSLGNVYSQQQRWPEAQQAFFDAYTRQSDNPDYAANLAISLDQMGQHKAALEYYQIAEQLAVNKPAGFNRAAIRARMDAIHNN